MRSRVCKCRRGYVSRYDGKCGHCRSTREQKTHIWKLRHDIYPAAVTYEGKF